MGDVHTKKGTGLPSATAGLAVAKTTPVPFSEGAQMKIRASVAALVICGLAIAGLAQAPPAVVLQITSPAANAFVNGPTLLRAVVDPDDAAASVIFFVDGRLICTVAQRPFECEWDAGAGVAEHQVRVVANLASGGRLVRTMRTKALGYTENVDVDVVQVTVTVSDGHGRFVRGLPQSIFHVSEDGRPQKITHFASEDIPLEIVVAIDISGSMTPSIPKLKLAVKEFLAAVPPTNQVTLLGFNDNIFTLTRKTTDPAERVRAVDHLAPWGSTALYDVILRGVDMLGRQTGRKALIVFTDGEDQGSHAAIADVERRLESSDVTLYMIAEGRGVTMEPLKKVMGRSRRRPAAARCSPTTSTNCTTRSPTAGRTRESVSARIRIEQRGARRCVAPHQGGRRRAPRYSCPPGLSNRGEQMTRCRGWYRARLSRAALTSAALLSLCIGGAAAEQQEQLPRFKAAVEVTSVDVTVVDDRGHPIPNLTAADFVVRIDGKERRA